MPDNPEEFTPPWIALEMALDELEDHHEASYRAPQSDAEQRFYQALDIVARSALDMLETGSISQGAEAVEKYEPWRPLNDRVLDLLSSNYLRRKTQIDVARSVVDRLKNLERRLVVQLCAFALLQNAHPSLVAFKYLRQASRVFLAGYDAEVYVMCGATLEAVMADRFPDSLLQQKGWKQKNKHTGTYSLGQRMEAEKQHPIFTDDMQRKRFWKLINWRNDVLHVQPDAPPPEAGLAILELASLLGIILPSGAA